MEYSRLLLKHIQPSWLDILISKEEVYSFLHMHYLTFIHNILSFAITLVLVCFLLNYLKFFSYLFAFQKLAGITMTLDPWAFRKSKVSEDIYKYEIYNSAKEQPISVKDAMNLMYGSAVFRNLLIKELSSVPFNAYFFETPPTNKNNFERDPFHFVLVNSRDFGDRHSDPAAFQEHFKPNCITATFQNMGRDATLIAPCLPLKESDTSHYTHLASFVRHADSNQVHELWRNVASAMVSRVHKQGEQRTWLSTSGLGVSWLHVRLDSRPKYYTYQPYKS